MAETLKKGDLAIVISYANRTPHVEDFIRVMNKNQVTTVLISSTKESELSNLLIIISILHRMKIQKKRLHLFLLELHYSSY